MAALEHNMLAIEDEDGHVKDSAVQRVAAVADHLRDKGGQAEPR